MDPVESTLLYRKVFQFKRFHYMFLEEFQMFLQNSRPLGRRPASARRLIHIQLMQRPRRADIPELPKKRAVPFPAEHKHLIELQSLCQIECGYCNPFSKPAAVPVNIKYIPASFF